MNLPSTPAMPLFHAALPVLGSFTALVAMVAVALASGAAAMMM